MTTLCTLIFLSWQMMSRSTRPPDPWRPRKQSSSSRSSGQCWLPLNRQALELLLAPPPCLRFLLLLQIMKNSKVKTTLFRLNESLVSERLSFGRFGPFLEIFCAKPRFFFLKFHFFALHWKNWQCLIRNLAKLGRNFFRLDLEFSGNMYPKKGLSYNQGYVTHCRLSSHRFFATLHAVYIHIWYRLPHFED